MPTISRLLAKVAGREGRAAEAAMPSREHETEPVPAFTTKLPVNAPGAPGMAGAEALLRKWADRWQEF